MLFIGLLRLRFMPDNRAVMFETDAARRSPVIRHAPPGADEEKNLPVRAYNGGKKRFHLIDDLPVAEEHRCRIEGEGNDKER